MNNKANFVLFFLLLSVFFSLSLASCEWKSEEDEVGIVECDTSQVTLSGTVKPILQTNCYSCHSAAGASSLGAGINLESYASLKSRATNGSLLGAIKHSSGYSPMPKGAAKIASCDIRLIETWINDGAKDD
ncbi:c-type cytochrome [Bernardetia sp. OM2101]|uniref:c-type cytochrome n=1 Tax=Bernardetia sp. OM2101 TaxID=3344876 RepID=UPI0035CFF115